VKREVPILVILGNPPYNGYAGVAVDEERSLSTAYRTARAVRQPQGQGLNDLYVRFFRMAERRIVEKTGKGIVCFISNYSWLDGLSFTAMRERFLESFDRMWIDNLHGDRKISEYAPDGRTSETIFAIHGHSPGIKVGTAVSLLAKSGGGGQTQPSAYYRDITDARAADRRARLLHSAREVEFNAQYDILEPSSLLGLPLKRTQVDPSYLSWPRLPELFPISFPGVKTSRDDFLVDIDRDRLEERLAKYFDPRASDEEVRRVAPGSIQDTPGFDARSSRQRLIKRGYLPEQVIRYCYRPFDVRWLYWEPETNLLDRKREDYAAQVTAANAWLVTQQKPRRDWSRPQIVRSLGCLDLMDRSATCIPYYLFAANHGTTGQSTLDLSLDKLADGAARINLAQMARDYMGHLPLDQHAASLFGHSLAVLHAPKYALENEGGLRQDWPRVPLPGTVERLTASARLGESVAALLDTEHGVVGVTDGQLRAELAAIGVVSRAGGGELNINAGELGLTAGWGHAGQGGVTMPGRGKAIERAYTPAELAAIDAGAPALALSLDEALTCLGDTTFDVYLNDHAYWRNVPSGVWRYTLGGYQVIKKWLSYREQPILGRPLKPEEAREVMNVARRIAALLLLGPALDANYAAVKQDTYPWPESAG